MAGLIDSAAKLFLRYSALVLVLGFGFSAGSVCEAQELPAPTIKVDVSRVNVGVTVTDHTGKFVEGLGKTDFRIFDNGVEQPVAGFLANDDPAQVVLMLECGPSMYFFGKESIQKADALITNLAPNDRVAIVCYSSNATVEYQLSEDKPAARMALRELNFAVGSAQLDLSKSLLAVFSWLATVPGKKTVVLIGSGVDSSPPEVPSLFQEAISASDVRVLAVSTSKQLTQFPKHHKRTLQERASRAQLEPMLKAGEETLRNLTNATGGRVYFPKSTRDLERTYFEIAQIVRHEYNLAFAPQTPDGKLHTLTVIAKHAFRVDHRQAYLAPGAPAN